LHIQAFSLKFNAYENLLQYEEQFDAAT